MFLTLPVLLCLTEGGLLAVVLNDRQISCDLYAQTCDSQMANDPDSHIYNNLFRLSLSEGLNCYAF